MDINALDGIKPYVRFVKIERRDSFSGRFVDFDNVFTLIATGRAHFILDGKNYEAEEGDVILMPPKLPHIIQCEEGKPITEYIFHFDMYDRNAHDYLEHRHISDLSIRRVGERTPVKEEMLLEDFPHVLRSRTEEGIELRRMFLYMHKEFNEKKPGYKGIMSALAQQMLISIYRNAPRREELPSMDTMKYWSSVRRVVEVIQIKYSTVGLSVHDIAGMVGLTPNHLSTLFRSNLGVSIYSYLNSVRVEVAKQMLYEGDFNVTQIAEQCGFSCIHTFSRAFKRITGVSPTQFAKNTTFQSK